MCEPISARSLLEPDCVPSQILLEDAIVRLNEADAGCLIVTDDGGRLTGIFAQGDVFYKMPGRETDLKNTTVASLMTENPTSLHESTPVRHLMPLHGYRHIPIIDEEGKPVKLASFKNILKFTEALFAPD